MKKILIAVLFLAGCSSGGVTEEEAIQNVRESVAIDVSKSDEDVKEAMQNACDLLDDLGVGLVGLTLREQGYPANEAKALLSNSAEVYCPEHLESVQEMAG